MVPPHKCPHCGGVGAHYPMPYTGERCPKARSAARLVEEPVTPSRRKNAPTIDTFGGGRVFASPERTTRWVGINESRTTRWVGINESRANGCDLISLLITGDNSDITFTISEAEALVRHLRRAIRRQKSRAAQ